MTFNCKIALIGLVTVVSSHGGNARFDIQGCDHLRLTNNDQCVETTRYGNNHDCTIRVLTDLRVDVKRWDVEAHDECGFDYLESRGADRASPYLVYDEKFCNGNSPDGHDLWKGQLLHWHTDVSITAGGWKICAAPKFRFRGRCDHLEITDGGNCVGTRSYGNDHDCQIETTGNFQYHANFFDVEDGGFNCVYDYFKIGDRKYCGDRLWRFEWNRHGTLIEWHTDESVTRGGFRVCGDSCFVTKTDYVGGDIGGVEYANSALECQHKCNAVHRCWVFTYDSSNRRCYLKDNIVNPNYNAHPKFISGWKESMCSEGNWRRLEDSNAGESSLLNFDDLFDQVLDDVADHVRDTMSEVGQVLDQHLDTTSEIEESQRRLEEESPSLELTSAQRRLESESPAKEEFKVPEPEAAAAPLL